MLFMLHDHFGTNIKHGATLALQDLFSVQLRGENLKAFILNWDQVLAGIVQTPDESVLETLFYKQVKNSKAIQHDMNENYRADEGTEKRTYSFLVSAVRRHLDRERLEANRDRVAKGLSGAGRPSTPAVEGKTGFIPKGYTVWHGTKGAVIKTTVLTSMKPQSHVTRVESPAKLEVAPLNVLSHPSQRVRAKEFASFGSRGVVIAGQNVTSFMRVQPGNLDRPLLPDRQVAMVRTKEKPVSTQKGRGLGALAALRARRVPNPPSLKDQGVIPRNQLHLPFA